MRVLVTGGAGYIGTTLVQMLLHEGYEVTVYDNLMHGGQALVPLFRNPKFRFIKADVRDKDALRKAVKEADAVVNLAAIVGYPACDADPTLAEQTNWGGAFNLARCVDNQPVVHASTISVYGKVTDGICTEESPMNPLSLYGSTKMRAEIFLTRALNVVSFRFPTVFGLSPRMRTDLLVNQLTVQAMRDRHIVVYEADARRPFIHIVDACNAIMFALNNYNQIQGQVFNPGNFVCNVTKRQLCEIVASKTGAKIIYAEVGKDQDGRDCEVSYDKYWKAGGKAVYTIPEGVEEVVRAYPALTFDNPYANI